MKINLDTFTDEQLTDFAMSVERHPRLTAKQYFAGEPDAVKTIKLLKAYAWNKATAIHCQQERNFKELIYLNICGKIYNQLPEYAKWR